VTERKLEFIVRLKNFSYIAIIVAEILSFSSIVIFLLPVANLLTPNKDPNRVGFLWSFLAAKNISSVVIITGLGLVSGVALEILRRAFYNKNWRDIYW